MHSTSVYGLILSVLRGIGRKSPSNRPPCVDTQIIILDYSKESTVYKLYYEMAESSDGDGAGMAGY